MMKYRIDFINNMDHLSRFYDDLQVAVNAAYEGRRDGYKTWLLGLKFDGYYEPLCELK